MVGSVYSVNLVFFTVNILDSRGKHLKEPYLAIKMAVRIRRFSTLGLHARRTDHYAAAVSIPAESHRRRQSVSSTGPFEFTHPAAFHHAQR